MDAVITDIHPQCYRNIPSSLLDPLVVLPSISPSWRYSKANLLAVSTHPLHSQASPHPPRAFSEPRKTSRILEDDLRISITPYFTEMFKKNSSLNGLQTLPETNCFSQQRSRVSLHLVASNTMGPNFLSSSQLYSNFPKHKLHNEETYTVDISASGSTKDSRPKVKDFSDAVENIISRTRCNGYEKLKTKSQRSHRSETNSYCNKDRDRREPTEDKAKGTYSNIHWDFRATTTKQEIKYIHSNTDWDSRETNEVKTKGIFRYKDGDSRETTEVKTKVISSYEVNITFALKTVGRMNNTVEDETKPTNLTTSIERPCPKCDYASSWKKTATDSSTDSTPSQRKGLLSQNVNISNSESCSVSQSFEVCININELCHTISLSEGEGIKNRLFSCSEASPSPRQNLSWNPRGAGDRCYAREIHPCGSVGTVEKRDSCSKRSQNRIQKADEPTTQNCRKSISILRSLKTKSVVLCRSEGRSEKHNSKSPGENFQIKRDRLYSPTEGDNSAHKLQSVTLMNSKTSTVRKNHPLSLQRGKNTPVKHWGSHGYTRKISDLQVWLRFVFFILWAGSYLTTAYGDEITRNGCELYSPHRTPHECTGIRWDFRGNTTRLAELCYCTRIIGNLKIVLTNRDLEAVQIINSFTFPDLREITGYLLMAEVGGLQSLHNLFPNLNVIRGELLFLNYALVIYRMHHLQEGLRSLNTILRGSVRISKNPKLCCVEDMDWDHITKRPFVENIIKKNRPRVSCDKCRTECHKSSGCVEDEEEEEEEDEERDACLPADQQVITACRNCIGGCIGIECCHEQCVGGCSSPGNSSSCVACRHIRYKGTCVASCPKGMYKLNSFECVTREQCSRMKYVAVSAQEMARETEKCVGTPADLQYEIGGSCLEPKETKTCKSAEVAYIQQAHDIRLCRKIESLKITINGTDNIESELCHLLNIEVIDRYLYIVETNIKSTNILKNIREIGGNINVPRSFSLVVMDNPRLQTLDPWLEPERNLTIKGPMMFQKNPFLCLDFVRALIKSASDSEVGHFIPLEFMDDGASCIKHRLKAHVWQSHEYGTLIVSIEEMNFTSESQYTIKYLEAPENISLPEPPCSNAEWVKLKDIRREGYQTKAKLSNLMPSTSYNVIVKTKHPSVSKANYSRIIQAQTSPFNPSPPETLSWAPGKESEVWIGWQQPRHPNGVIDHYLVSGIKLPSTNQVESEVDYCQQKDKLRDIKEKLHNNRLSADEWIKVMKEKLMGKGENENTCKSRKSKCCHCNSPRKTITFKQGEENIIKYFEHNIIKDVQNDSKTDRNIQYMYGIQTVEDDATGNNKNRREIEAASFLEEGETTQGSPTTERSPEIQVPDIHALFIASLEGRSRNHLRPLDQRDSDMIQSDALLAEYQEHTPDINYSYVDPSDSTYVVAHQLTYGLNATLTNLKPHTQYLISVMACQAPINCRNPLGNGNHGKPVRCKLCSLVPANTAVITPPADDADLIPKNSLTAKVQNHTNIVKVSWDPPSSSNGGILFYQVEYKLKQIRMRSRCIKSQDFLNNGSSVHETLGQGNYTVCVTARSQARYALHSNCVNVYVPGSNKSSYYQSSWGTLASILVSLVVLIIVIVVCLVRWRRNIHKSKHSIPDAFDELENTPINPERFPLQGLFSTKYLLSHDELKVHMNKPLGRGHFGLVVSGESTKDGRTTKVAVKTLLRRRSSKEIREFLKEAVVMQNLDCHHIVKLIGVVGDCAPAYIVLELMEKGDLHTYLVKLDKNISTQQIVRMALQAADGMAYLAWHRMVHRDLAARNCLLDQNLTLKICDFGLARDVRRDESPYDGKGTGFVSFKWMAPESLQFSRYTTKSDVWSYGVVLWEMCKKGETPFKDWNQCRVQQTVIEERKTLPLPKGPPFLVELMKQCWEYNSVERPGFDNILDYLLKYTDEEFLSSFESVSFFHSTRLCTESICQECEPATGFRTTTQHEDGHWAVNTTSAICDKCTSQPEAGERHEVSAQAECLSLYHDDHLHCPCLDALEPLVQSFNTLQRNSSSANNMLSLTTLPSSSEKTGTKGRCSTNFCADSTYIDNFQNKADSHCIHTNDMISEELPHTTQSLLDSRRQENHNEVRANLKPSSTWATATHFPCKREIICPLEVQQQQQFTCNLLEPCPNTLPVCPSPSANAFPHPLSNAKSVLKPCYSLCTPLPAHHPNCTQIPLPSVMSHHRSLNGNTSGMKMMYVGHRLQHPADLETRFPG